MDYKKLYEQSQKENEELKNEQFDEMEKIAKQQGMCLVDIPIFDKLIEKEKENQELKEENEKLKKESERLERLRITFINRYGELKKIVCPDSQFQDHKRIREGCLKLKKENEEKNHTILTWKMSASLKDTEIDELKEELEELKKMNKTNYDEKEKMKAFLGELRINVVKKD